MKSISLEDAASVNEQKRTKVGRAMELRAELFDIANFLAGEETGRLAVELHQACNAILRVHTEINRKPPKVEFFHETEDENDLSFSESE